MPADIGTQSVTLKWLTEAASRKVNERYHEVRPTGIYRGGYLSAVDSTNITISPLVCEIADDTNGYQVRVETAATVTINEATLTGKYIVLRWDYTGSATVDYMALLAVTAGNVRADDLIVGYCISASNFDYGNAVYRRSNPATHDHFLRVDAPDAVAMAAAPMKVRVREGQIQSNAAVVQVDDQPTPSSFTTPSSGTEYGLVYIDSAGAVQIVDNDGETSVPDFGGKNVLAIVTITSTDTIITQSMITDVRNWIAPAIYPDDITIEKASSGVIQVKSIATQYTPSAYTGQESVTEPNGRIIKEGKNTTLSGDAGSEGSGTVSFAVSFPTGIKSIQLTPVVSTRAETVVLSADSVNVNGFTWRYTEVGIIQNMDGFYWRAVGW